MSQRVYVTAKFYRALSSVEPQSERAGFYTWLTAEGHGTWRVDSVLSFCNTIAMVHGKDNITQLISLCV
jgi:hypothetical protein